MLVIKLYVNLTQIDEIHVQNVSSVGAESVCGYKIRKPEGHEEITFYHIQKDGAVRLTEKVMGYLADEDYRPSSPFLYSGGLVDGRLQATRDVDKLINLLKRWRDKHSCVDGDPPAYRCNLCRDTDVLLKDIRER